MTPPIFLAVLPLACGFAGDLTKCRLHGLMGLSPRGDAITQTDNGTANNIPIRKVTQMSVKTVTPIAPAAGVDMNALIAQITAQVVAQIQGVQAQVNAAKPVEPAKPAERIETDDDGHVVFYGGLRNERRPLKLYPSDLDLIAKLAKEQSAEYSKALKSARVVADKRLAEYQAKKGAKK